VQKDWAVLPDWGPIIHTHTHTHTQEINNASLLAQAHDCYALL